MAADMARASLPDAVRLPVLDEHTGRRNRITASRIDRFAAHGAWHLGPGRVPLLDDVLARIVCRVARRLEFGDHTIVLASPVVGDHRNDETETPLVYHAGGYADLGSAA